MDGREEANVAINVSNEEEDEETAINVSNAAYCPHGRENFSRSNKKKKILTKIYNGKKFPPNFSRYEA